MGGSQCSRATELAYGVRDEMDPNGLIDGLEEWVRWRVRGLLFLLALAGYGRAKVICGYRGLRACEELFGLGRTAEELEKAGVPPSWAAPEAEKVTWILPRCNLHERRRAVDIDLTMYSELNVEAISRLARVVGMIYGGVWSVRDTYHFEV